MFMSQSLKTFNLNDELTLRQDKLFILLECKLIFLEIVMTFFNEFNVSVKISMEQKTNVYLYKKSYAK